MTPRSLLSAIAATAVLGVIWSASGPQPAGAPPPQGQPAGTAKPAPNVSSVTQAQFERWMTELSNWGRWGKDDERGALNLITPEKRRQAAALAKTGTTVSPRARSSGRSHQPRRSRVPSTGAALWPTSFTRSRHPARTATALFERQEIEYHGGALSHFARCATWRTAAGTTTASSSRTSSRWTADLQAGRDDRERRHRHPRHPARHPGHPRNARGRRRLGEEDGHQDIVRRRPAAAHQASRCQAGWRAATSPRSSRS